MLLYHLGTQRYRKESDKDIDLTRSNRRYETEIIVIVKKDQKEDNAWVRGMNQTPVRPLPPGPPYAHMTHTETGPLQGGGRGPSCHLLSAPGAHSLLYVLILGTFL